MGLDNFVKNTVTRDMINNYVVYTNFFEACVEPQKYSFFSKKLNYFSEYRM